MLSQNSRPTCPGAHLRPFRILHAHLDPMHTSRNIQTHLLNLIRPSKRSCTTLTSNPARITRSARARTVTPHAPPPTPARTLLDSACPVPPNHSLRVVSLPQGLHCAHCHIGTSVCVPICRPNPSYCSRAGVGFPARPHHRPHPSDASRHLAWWRPPPIVDTEKGAQGSPHGSSVLSGRTAPI